MNILWWLFEIGLILATTLFFFTAWAYWDEIKKYKVRIANCRKRNNPELVNFYELRVKDLKAQMGCWATIGLCGLWAIIDNLFNNIMR